MKLALLLILAAASAQAGTLFTSATVITNYAFCQPNCPQDMQIGTGGATAHAFVSDGGMINAGGTIGASASYGNLQISGSGSGPQLSGASNPSLLITGRASFLETLVIEGGTGTGTLVWTISDFNCGCIDSITGPLGVRQFTYGVPFTLGISAHATDSSLSGGFGLFVGQQVSSSLQIGIGSPPPPVPGVTYRTTSGSPYTNFNNAAFAGALELPEPASFALVAGALALMAGWSGRRALRVKRVRISRYS